MTKHIRSARLDVYCDRLQRILDVHIRTHLSTEALEIEILGEHIKHDAVHAVLDDADTHHRSAVRTR